MECTSVKMEKARIGKMCLPPLLQPLVDESYKVRIPSHLGASPGTAGPGSSGCQLAATFLGTFASDRHSGKIASHDMH